MKNIKNMNTKDFNLFSAKMLRIEMKNKIKIKNTNIHEKKLEGYFHIIGLAANPPYLPANLFFVHRAISDNPVIKIKNELTTKLNIMEIIYLELI